MMVHFNHGGKAITLQFGEHFARPHAAGFRDTPSADLLNLVVEIERGAAWREAVRARYEQARPWLYRIISSSTRTAFFQDVLPAGSGLVLDIGAGWGQIARPLAARRRVVALEPVHERLQFIRAAARQDGVHENLAFLETGYFETEFSTRFAVICAIGVLEWVGAFEQGVDPQDRQRQFLRKARSELEPGGVLILGIENRLGLKYLLGAPDDHIGVPHVACLPAPQARVHWQRLTGHALTSFTYSQVELRRMLQEAGFTDIDFFGAFPDYKVAEQIVPFGESGGNLNTWLRAHTPPPEHNGYDGSVLPATIANGLSAHYRSLADENVAHAFVPSFFVRAS